MALKDLTVNAFLLEVIQSLDLPPLKDGTKFLITFSGQSSQFNINFERSELLLQVYKRVSTIEANRQHLRKSSSTEALNGMAKASSMMNQSYEVERQPIIAEFDMIRQQFSEGPKEKRRRRSHHRSSSQKVKRN